LAFAAVASAGFASPAVYSAGPAVYAAGPAYATYAQAPVIAKTVVPAAQSYAFQNRAPAARLAVSSNPTKQKKSVH